MSLYHSLKMTEMSCRPVCLYIQFLGPVFFPSMNLNRSSMSPSVFKHNPLQSMVWQNKWNKNIAKSDETYQYDKLHTVVCFQLNRDILEISSEFDLCEIYVLEVHKSMRYLFLTNSVFFLRDGIHAPGTSSWRSYWVFGSANFSGSTSKSVKQQRHMIWVYLVTESGMEERERETGWRKQEQWSYTEKNVQIRWNIFTFTVPIILPAPSHWKMYFSYIKVWALLHLIE